MKELAEILAEARKAGPLKDADLKEVFGLLYELKKRREADGRGDMLTTVPWPPVGLTPQEFAEMQKKDEGAARSRPLRRIGRSGSVRNYRGYCVTKRRRRWVMTDLDGEPMLAFRTLREFAAAVDLARWNGRAGQ